MRALLPVALAIGLAACAGAPKKAPSPPLSSQDTPGAPASGRKSPYAPAQEDPGKRGDYVAGGLYAPHIRDSVPGEIPDVDAIPEPEVTDEPRSRVGNRSSYTVLGKRYTVLASAKGYVETGIASYYGKKFHGRRTSNLEVYDMYAFTAAHKSLPLPSFARVTNLENGRSVIVRVNDRGPFHAGRIIDLSYAAAAKLGYVHKGTARVEVRALMPGDAQQPIYAGTRNNNAPATGPSGTARAQPAATAMDRLVAAMPVATMPIATMPIATTAAAAAPGPDNPVPAEPHFDMRDGRPMSAAEFEEWMRSRQIRIATGKPGQPAPAAAALPATAGPLPRADGSVTGGERVILQIASFAARANADRALALLQGAGIGEARVFDGDANGRKVWRLRVGPLSAALAPELAARIASLGFGSPQRIRE